MTGAYAELVVQAGAEPGRRFPLAPGQPLELGRREGEVGLLDDAQASRQHARVASTAEGVLVMDLGSKNGTTLNGARLPPNEPRAVRAGDVIRIGRHELLFRAVRACPGAYVPVALLGEGASGAVWSARETATGRLVAVKTLASRVDAAGRARFLREGRIRVASPHVVWVHDVVVEDDHAFLVMELMAGRSALELLAQGPLPLGHALAIGHSVAAALADAHAAGVIHRDVKPGNVLVGADGTVKLSDFGIARLQSELGALTASNAGLGSLSYVAPEQALDAKRAGPAADLYSLGSTLYHLLAGHPPFLPGPDLLQQLFQTDPPRLQRVRRDCPPDVARLVHGLLEKDPEDRLGPAAHVRDELARLRGRVGR